MCSTGVRSWLDSLPKELAERVAFDLDKEPAVGTSLTDTILTAPPKWEFNLAHSSSQVMRDDGDERRKRHRSAPEAPVAKRTYGMGYPVLHTPLLEDAVASQY